MQEAYSRGRPLGSAKGQFSQQCSVQVNRCSGDTAGLYISNPSVCLNNVLFNLSKNKITIWLILALVQVMAWTVAQPGK